MIFNLTLANTSTGSFNYNLLDPALSTAAQFVAELERYTKNHPAVNHHFLENLACAAFGEEETADLLLRFFAAYSKFNSGFVPNVRRLIDVLDTKEHKAVLKENLREEEGYYGEETYAELEKMGISREGVANIPHPVLYREMIDTLEKKLKRSYAAFVPENIADIMKKVSVDLVSGGKIGLLAAIYFGSELIVPQLYTRLLQGLRNSCGISNQDARFLILHIDMDHDHADKLRKVVMANCKTRDDRTNLVKVSREHIA